MLSYNFTAFLDTYLNMVKDLRRVPLDVSIQWRYLHQDTRNTYSKMSKMGSYEVFKSNYLQAHEKEYRRLRRRFTEK